MKLTQEELVKRYLTDEWIEGFKLRSIATTWGWIGSQGDRRARKLFEKKEIERDYIKGIVVYRRKQEKPRLF